jgi:hypothetical protein
MDLKLERQWDKVWGKGWVWWHKDSSLECVEHKLA